MNIVGRKNIKKLTFEGFVDFDNSDFTPGWVWCPNFPFMKLTVEVLLNGKVIDMIVADQFRGDLKKAGKGDGEYAFRYDSKGKPAESLVFRVMDTDFELRKSGTSKKFNSLNHSNSIKKVQVGCGPHNILPDWWNVDIRSFPGIDQVFDVTKPWPFNGLEYVYGEHFLEHLSLEGAISFLNNAWQSLRPDGVIRLSTPSLEWVLSTHFNLSETNTQKCINSTFSINRAFHGWGHQFLYSQDFLKSIFDNLGWQKVVFCDYGKSKHQSLKGIERHGKFQINNGYPNVWIVEGTRGNTRYEPDFLSYQKLVDEAYMKYVKSGH